MHQNRRRSGGGPSASRSSSNPSGSGARTSEQQQKRPLVVALNCLEDVSPEQDALAGVATVEHVGLGQVSGGRIESAAVVLVHSLAFLPRAAQRRLQPWQLVLCLGSADRPVDSAIAVELGLRLVHVDAGRAEEVADTVMALLLGLLRRTHLLSRQASLPAAAVARWLGSIQPLCRGMRRCRGLVLGIVGKSASARCLATRSLAFRISVLYFDVHLDRSSGKPEKCSITFPSAARRMDTLNDLLAASDLISLHCALSEDTVHIINAERLQHIKPGAFIVNTGSSQLIDDCALKQLLLDGTVAGCALDGVEGPQWMEAWVREMPNVLVLPRSADYSEEVWIEIREKAISVLKTFFLDGTVPESAVSDEEDELIVDYNESPVVIEPITGENEPLAKYNAKETGQSTKETLHHSHSSGVTQSAGFRLEGRRSRSGRKSKKRSVRRRSRPKSDDLVCLENEGDSAKPNDQAATSSRDQVQSSSSRFASPEDSRNKPICRNEYTVDSTLDKKGVLDLGSSTKICELLKDGHVIALHPKDETGLLVSRQRVPGGGWILDTVANVTKRDPAAQFLVNFRSKDVMGLRSFSAGGKLLQINRRMEFVFASYSFDVWESWTLEGFQLEQCKLVNCRNPLAVLDVHIEILAAIDEEDGVARWLE